MKAGLIDQGEEYTCQTKVIQFSKNAASSQEDFLPYRTIFCCSVVRSERALFDNAHSFKHIALWKGCSMSIMLHVLCRNIIFFQRDTAPFKGGLDIWKCTLHSFKGHGATVQGILHILFGYCPCKNTLHCPKGRLVLFRRVCLFWILHLLAGMGML